MIDPRRARHCGKPQHWRGLLALRGLFALSAMCCAAGSEAFSLDENLALSCNQRRALQLQCHYRLREGGELQAALGQWRGLNIQAELGARYPQAGDNTALLLLVDTSDPARAPALRAAITHISTLLAAAPQHLKIGLASFDSDLRLLAPIGSDRVVLLANSTQLLANGRTTELYRNVGEAVRVLSKSAATRKVLWVFSDGLAEDHAYHHEDIIALARNHDVIINSIGYPRSIPQSVALQTLRRLSNDSGGQFLQTTFPEFNLPADSLQRALGLLDNGGQLTFDLGALVAKGGAGTSELSLTFQTHEQQLAAMVPIVLPIGKAQTTAETAPAPATLPFPRATAGLAAQGLNAVPMWPWFSSLMAVSLVILGAVTLLYLRVKRAPQLVRAAAGKPLAWLLLAEAPFTRHAVDHLPWRIGRAGNHDCTLTDHSVSRLHAEVRGNQLGGVTLHDLRSLNGVFVNDTRIEAVELRDGDVVDIGDVRMRFTLHDESHAAQEATVMVRTRTPA